MFEDLQTLLQPCYRSLWVDYCCYLDMGWRRFSDSRFDAKQKHKQLQSLERAIRKDFPLSSNLLARLQKQFVAENLSLSLLLEPMTAWQYIALNQQPETDTVISEIVLRTATPAARLLMVLNDETPSTYLPMTSILTALFLKVLIQTKSPYLKKIKHSRKQWYTKLSGLCKNAFVILSIIRSKRLKFKLAVLLNTLFISLGHMQNNKQSQMYFLDRMKVILYSIYQFITIRKRTTTREGF